MSRKIEINQPSPDFTLSDFNGRAVALSDFRGQKHVFLAFNRGFM